jgi:hypothetical protein
MIWKDVSFSHCYLLVTALLLRSNLLHTKLSKYRLVLILALLTYGTGVKYQALYLLPIYAWWLADTLGASSFLKKTGTVIFMVGAIYGINVKVEERFVLPQNNSHAWQMARLYDLAGISYWLKEAVFPNYILYDSRFSMDKILKDYNPGNIDSLIYGKDVPLKTTQSTEDLQELWSLWQRAVVKYPIPYLKHRLSIWLKLMNRKPDNYFVCLSDYGQQLYFKNKAIPLAETYMSWFPSFLTRYYWMLILFIISFKWGRKKAEKAEIEKRPFIYLPIIGITQISIYFFLSMASDLRYLYLSNILGLCLTPFLLSLKKRSVKA